MKGDQNRSQLLTQLYRNNTYDEYGGSSSNNERNPGTLPQGNRGQTRNGQAGGVTIQDFQPLIDLIKSTIKPDDWDDTNGDGTINPYLAGVYVDAAGEVKRIKATDSSSLDRIRINSLADSGNRQSAFTSQMRKVSLTRLEKAAQLLAAQGKSLPDDMLNLAGIYQIDYLMLYPESGDIVIAGPAGPWTINKDGRRVNTTTGKPVLQLDDLVVCLRNAKYKNAKFGCSIDPRQANLAATKQYLASSKLIGKPWREKLREVLGQQDIRVFGIDPRTHAGRILVEADYRMKLIGMGLEASMSSRQYDDRQACSAAR